MKHSILVIDDEKIGANNIKKYFDTHREDINTYIASEEEDILNKISNLFYDIAIVDLRMDNFSFNGFEIIKNIIEINPFAKIIIISAHLSEFEDDINDILQSGKISGVFAKEKFDDFISKLNIQISRIIDDLENDKDFISNSLIELYRDVKNESDNKIKGKLFEKFAGLLFFSMGFVDIQSNFRDKSMNEIDLIIRNESNDNFFKKFSPYFLIECKNISNDIDKNMFIQFKEKLSNSNGLAKLGFIITTKGFKSTSYKEALRTSSSDFKIIFLSNIEIEKLINSSNMIKELKNIIDSQCKDN